MADLAGSLVSFGLNRLSQDHAFNQQKELQRQAQDYNTLMFHMANAYNSPMAQMNRFKQAGLNPNLIYGQAAGNASAPSINAGSAPSPAQAPAISMLESAQVGLVNAQKKNIEADTANKEADTVNKNANTNLLTTQEIINKADLDIRQRLADSQISVNDETIEQMKANISNLAQQTENLKVDNAIKSIQLEWDKASFDDRVKLVKAQWRAANASANLSDAQAHRITTLLNQELSNLQAEFARIVADTNLTNQQQSNLAQQKVIDAADNAYLLLAQEYRKNGNFMERNFGVVSAEFTHFLSHVLRFGLK